MPILTGPAHRRSRCSCSIRAARLKPAVPGAQVKLEPLYGGYDVGGRGHAQRLDDGRLRTHHSLPVCPFGLSHSLDPASAGHGTPEHLLGSLTWGQDNPEANAAAGVVRVDVVAKGNPAVVGAVVPTAATTHAVRADIARIPIPTPLTHVPPYIVQAISVLPRLKRTPRTCVWIRTRPQKTDNLMGMSYRGEMA